MDERSRFHGDALGAKKVQEKRKEQATIAPYPFASDADTEDADSAEMSNDGNFSRSTLRDLVPFVGGLLTQSPQKAP